ncbi:hypothetical protein EYF80_033084 [Liparis tanakae]|uniref:Uncharacterized protein n=1 Tax=Liparis tanakae TaxID=230148 RepID=A0A4Z2GTL0_9TELE|nr:hypothetical protein EYF80_033084 [Liparis tanakae]
MFVIGSSRGPGPGPDPRPPPGVRPAPPSSPRAGTGKASEYKAGEEEEKREEERRRCPPTDRQLQLLHPGKAPLSPPPLRLLSVRRAAELRAARGRAGRRRRSSSGQPVQEEAEKEKPPDRAR